MIDDRQIELIHAGVDGELDEAGQAELRALLDESEEARHHHSELNRLAEFLDKIPDHELPDGLHARIVDEIELPRPSPFRSFFNFGELPGLIRYGFAGAAGLVLAIAILGDQADMGGPEDLSNMAGTISKGGLAGEMIDSWSFEQDGAVAKARLSEKQGTLVLEIDMTASGPLGLVIDVAGSGLQIDAFTQLDSELESVSWSGDQLQASGSGRQKFAVLMHRAGDDKAGDGAGIDLEFSRQGAVIQEGELELGR